MSTFDNMVQDTAQGTASTAQLQDTEDGRVAILTRDTGQGRAPYWAYIREDGPWGEQLEQWKRNYKHQQEQL
jgi:hypothetical protein